MHSKSPLLTGPVTATLARLAAPNILALTIQSLVVIAETSYIGLIGTESLAAMALVFPMIMLTQMVSSGAMGGGVSSAVARALGAGDDARARTLAVHAVVIGALGGLLFTTVFLTFGPTLFRLLGGRDGVLSEALAYSRPFFAGALSVWLFNTLASIVRGTGNMRVPSGTIIAVAVFQIALGGSLSLGLGAFPRMGIAGVAIGQIAAFGLGTFFLLWQLRSGRLRVTLKFSGIVLSWEMFRDILKVGAVAALSPIQSVMTVLILSGLVAGYGTETLAGYGIGVRLEFLLVPIAFAIGVASVPMVGMAIGAGDVPRARRVAWTAGILSAAIIGVVAVIATAWPGLWASLFTTDPAVKASTHQLLRSTGPFFPLMGFGLAIYFASQGSGRILGPVLAGTVRLAVIAVGGWAILRLSGPASWLFVLVGLAMLAYGAAMALSLWLTSWNAEPASARLARA